MDELDNNIWIRESSLTSKNSFGRRVWYWAGWILLSISAVIWLVILFTIPEEGEWETILCFATVISITIVLGILGVMREQPYGKMRMISGLFISAVGSWSLVAFGIGFGLTSELIAIIPGFLAIVSGIFVLISWNDMRNWPLATATITDHRIEKGRMTVHIYDMIDEWVDAFIPVIHYEYMVDSRTFDGRWKGSRYQDYDSKELNVEYINLLHTHPVGERFQIRYYQGYQSKNIIDKELGFKKATGLGLIYSGIVLCIGGICLSLGLYNVLSLVFAFIVSIITFIFSYRLIRPKEGFLPLSWKYNLPWRTPLSFEYIESFDDPSLSDILKKVEATHLQDYEELIHRISIEITKESIRKEAKRALLRIQEWKAIQMERLI